MNLKLYPLSVIKNQLERDLPCGRVVALKATPGSWVRRTGVTMVTTMSVVGTVRDRRLDGRLSVTTVVTATPHGASWSAHASRREAGQVLRKWNGEDNTWFCTVRGEWRAESVAYYVGVETWIQINDIPAPIFNYFNFLSW